jgi:hypothetical protein
MKQRVNSFSTNQLIFQELFIGTLIYSSVLGFFSDYTDIVFAKSFSVIFFSSIVLEILTFMTFKLKKSIINWLKKHSGKVYTALTFFCVWLVMFLSKFVFIFFLDLFFGSYIRVEGFFGILAVVLSVTIIHRLSYKIFEKLA